jgi:copper chaperone CopZ
MTQTYRVEGMTCKSCEAKVKNALLGVPNVTKVEVSKELKNVIISVEKPVLLGILQYAVGEKYSILEMEPINTAIEKEKSWFVVYRPILLLFVYISLVSILTSIDRNGFHWMKAMNIFMAGFFLTFSFFKFLDIKGFADSYSMYDIVAKHIKSWGFVYVFVEASLGFAYAINFAPIFINIITLILMAVGTIGVLQTVLNKRKIKCACLGSVFNLPMSTVTIVENLLMFVMSGSMLLLGHF